MYSPESNNMAFAHVTQCIYVWNVLILLLPKLITRLMSELHILLKQQNIIEFSHDRFLVFLILVSLICTDDCICSPNPCRNEGRCSCYGSYAWCTCLNDWTGTRCEKIWSHDQHMKHLIPMMSKQFLLNLTIASYAGYWASYHWWSLFITLMHKVYWQISFISRFLS